MNPIRPQTPPPQTPAPASTARTAAQRAFFQAAMGQAQAPAKAAATPEPVREAARVQTVRAETPAEPPTKILRPGSLLDIRV